MSDKSAPTLERSVSLIQATIYGVGIILGAGIYALIGEAAGIAGNTVWVSFVLAAVIAGFSAVSYAELSALFPKSAAEFVYVKEITGSPATGFLVGYVTILTGVISVAAVALGFASYFKLYLQVNPVLVGIVVILLGAALNFSGIQQSARVNTVFTLIEASGLIFIVIVGFRYLGQVDLFALDTGVVTSSGSGYSSIVGAAALVFFAYIGFEDIANIAEETRSASKNTPLAIMYSLIITTIIYILVAMVAVSVVPAETLYAAAKLDNPSEGPLALVASTALNSPLGGQLFTVVALCATANTVLVLHIVTSRMIFGMARENCLPKFLASINKRTRTPANAILISTLLCALFTLSGSLNTVANLTNVGVFLVFFLVNLMLVMHRYQSRNVGPEEKTGWLRYAGNVGWFPVFPFLGGVFCLAMLLTQFWQPIDVFGFSMPLVIFSAIIIVAGLPIYFLSRRQSGGF